MRWSLPAILCVHMLIASAAGQPRWSEEFCLVEFFGPSSDDLYAMVAGDLGEGERLWLGGAFTGCAGLTCTSVVEWNGLTWRNMPGAPPSVRALALFNHGAGPELYAGSAAGLHRWTGGGWEDLDVTGAVHALAVWNDGRGAALYAGGAFTSAGGDPASNLARWDGASWEAVGAGTDGPVNALAGFDPGDGRLYIGGAFTTAGSAGALNVAAWDGAAFAALGAGLDGAVNALAWYDGPGKPEMFAGGAFRSPGDRLASWNGVQWKALYPLSGEVYAMARVTAQGRDLLGVTGRFQGVTTFTRGLLLWDGEAPVVPPDWSPQFPRCLAMFDSGKGAALHIGGGDGINPRPARLEQDRWASLGVGFRNYTSHGTSRISALAALDGGDRLGAAGHPNDAVAWDGQRWDYFGGPVPSAPWVDSVPVAHALAPFEGALYLLGWYGPYPEMNFLLRTTGAGWSPLPWRLEACATTTRCGPGGGGDMLVHDDGRGEALFVTASIERAGGAPTAKGIARWDGEVWSTLGLGLRRMDGSHGEGRALATFDDGAGEALYVGGDFAFAGEVEATGVARWDGARWSALAEGVQGVVSTLAVHDDGTGPSLFAAGEFIAAGGLAINVARWDGARWWPVGDGLDGPVQALASFDDGRGPGLFAAGSFGASGSEPAHNIARWDGGRWDAVGGGLDSRAVALQVIETPPLGPALYVGGYFRQAGMTPSSRIAKWIANRCRVDLDGDGALTLFDFLTFFNLFAAGDLAADFDGDGELTVFDFLAFQDEFGAGC
ncbi:MAG: GC-type dockerin domain-anchored protein [Phycisphaerales bacterium JB039]